MKKLSVLVMALASGSGFAGSICMGEAYSGDVVRVDIYTTGTMGRVESGEVTIRHHNGDLVVNYKLLKENGELPQYFEGCREGDCQKQGTIVGLGGYKDNSYAVTVNYLGTDFAYDSRPLVDVLRDPNRPKQTGNRMRVWAGDLQLPTEDQYYLFKDVVCSLDHEVK